MKLLGAASKRLAEPENVAVGMPNVQLPNSPWHVSGCESDFDSLFLAVLIKSVNVIDPYRHPNALVAALIAVVTEGAFNGAAAAAALGVLA